jgi:5-carboxymethyl-2-hydroxymuconate isomerase
VAEESKNRCRKDQMANSNLKRSGFVKMSLKLSISRNEQNKVPLFFDEREAVKNHIAGLTKRFGYFGAPKYHAPAA